MRKLIILATLIMASASMAFAQSTDAPKVEFFGGFSVKSIDTGLDSSGLVLHNSGNRLTAYGFETSVTGYITKRFGIEGNVDGHYRSKTFDLSLTPTSAIFSVDTKVSDYNFMAGPHFRFPSGESKVTPFVHALAGGNHSRLRGSVTGLTINQNETDFALKLGGGIDIGVSDHVGVRLAADYNPVFEAGNDILVDDGRTRHDGVFSVGLVFK